jgi:hypothetical protein
MGAVMNRRQLLVAAGAGAVGTAAALGAAPLKALAAEGEGDGFEGSWYVTVQVTSPSPASFDVLYGFAKGGVFTRIDGRNNGASVGTWKQTDDGGIVFSNILFNFPMGVLPSPTSRNGAIVGNFAAHLKADGTMEGTFTAHGIPPLVFNRAGTFTGTKIEAVGP